MSSTITQISVGGHEPGLGDHAKCGPKKSREIDF
jgi:hypothetical protein